MAEEIFYLKEGMTKLGISVKSLMEALDATQPYISGLLNGKKSIGATVAVRLYEKYGIDPYWTLTGKGSILKDNQKVINDKENLIKDDFESRTLTAQMKSLNEKLEYLIKSDNLNRVFLKTIMVHLDITMENFKPAEEDLEKNKKTASN